MQLMAGLKYNKETIKQVFSEGIVRESVIFQEILQEGEARGEAKGKAQGEAIGRTQTQLEIARGMLQEGIDIATIARITQLTPEQISQLQRS
jgi:predicted transposase/invertase (TIGR01784 family)